MPECDLALENITTSMYELGVTNAKLSQSMHQAWAGEPFAMADCFFRCLEGHGEEVAHTFLNKSSKNGLEHVRVSGSGSACVNRERSLFSFFFSVCCSCRLTLGVDSLTHC